MPAGILEGQSLSPRDQVIGVATIRHRAVGAQEPSFQNYARKQK
jgi:hypothetical protein